MSGIRYILDEHVSFGLRRAIHHQSPEVEVWRIGDASAPPGGTLDPDILIWCEKFNFSLVTNNRSTMGPHLRDHLALRHHVPGIFILNPKMSLGETAAELALIAIASDPEEYADRINFLPVSK